jgi:hypothetical protein
VQPWPTRVILARTLTFIGFNLSMPLRMWGIVLRSSDVQCQFLIVTSHWRVGQQSNAGTGNGFGVQSAGWLPQWLCEKLRALGVDQTCLRARRWMVTCVVRLEFLDNQGSGSEAYSRRFHHHRALSLSVPCGYIRVDRLLQSIGAAFNTLIMGLETGNI